MRTAADEIHRSFRNQPPKAGHPAWYAYGAFLCLTADEQEVVGQWCDELRDLRSPVSGKVVKGLGWATTLEVVMELAKYLCRGEG